MQVHDQPTLGFYAQPAAMTSAGRYADLVKSLPRDIPALAAIAQGLLIHEHMAQAYGVTLSETDRASVHIRPVEHLLAQIVARDDRPLCVARTPAARLPANCRHFTVLMTAILRAQGTPARARCGFGGYFGSSLFEDHWACEYWQRWILVDAQIDDRRRDWFPIDFDVTDVPRDRFLIAGQVWARCRSGAADPGRFGLSLTGEAGDWWIAGNLMRDAAHPDTGRRLRRTAAALPGRRPPPRPAGRAHCRPRSRGSPSDQATTTGPVNFVPAPLARLAPTNEGQAPTTWIRNSRLFGWQSHRIPRSGEPQPCGPSRRCPRRRIRPSARPKRHPDDLPLVFRPARVGALHALRMPVRPPGPLEAGQYAGCTTQL